MQRRRILGVAGALLLAGVLLYGLGQGFGPVPALGTLLDPADGLYRTARQATTPASGTLRLSSLDAPVTIVRDERSVPHIFAESDRDAIIALGYVTAQDRLFQMDFVPRVASGRLAEAFGAGSVDADRFLRETGMDWGARRNLEQIREEESEEGDVMRWYSDGVNAYLDRLDPEDLPLEFRLLDYTPDRYTPLQILRVLQYMTYDLTYGSDDAAYAKLQERLDDEAYDVLYPRNPWLYAPIIPPREEQNLQVTSQVADSPVSQDARAVLEARAQKQDAWKNTPLEGYRPGKGSNNWAADSERSTTGAPILAGDMHLSLNLPAIWYEAHLVTPSMNSYGVTVPGAPILVEAFNDHVGWAFTNTGSDQIDHLAMEIDSARQRYRFEEDWRELEAVLDTIRVKDGEPVVDTLYYSHHGPVLFDDEAADDAGAVALRWVAHERSRTLRALWGMNRAQNLEEFEAALRDWDTPMQNILYAGTDGHIAIRSTGYLPVRRAGHGIGLLDGTTDRFDWVGRVPFDSLPHARDPAQGFLTSSNQKPTGDDYPYYLGHDWGDAYRSLRLDTLLRGSAEHSVDDFKRYQSDVHAVQRDLFVPLLDPLEDLSARADTLRRMLQAWDGATSVDRPEPLVLDTFLKTLNHLTWDEEVFDGVPDPGEMQLLRFLREEPSSTWLDVQDTDRRESANELLALALEATADSLDTRYGWDADHWRWGDHHEIVFRHLTEVPAFGRGPFEYPGFEATVSPAGGRPTTSSASWRVVVDFSTSPPVGYGVYPGGQSGDPFDPDFYDAHLSTYLDFEHYRLLKPTTPDELPADQVEGQIELLPVE